MKNSALKTAVLLSGFAATSAFAQSESGSPVGNTGATFWIDHNVLTWTNEKVKPESGSDQEVTALQTTPDDVTIGIFWDNYGVYVQPNNAGGAVGLSLFPTKEVEVGVLLGTTRTKDESGPTGNETEQSNDTLGLFGNYYYPIDAGSALEIGAKLVFGKGESESTAAGVTTETETDSNRFELGIQYDYQIAKHFHILPGIAFHIGKQEQETAGVKTDEDTSGLTLNFAHFRYVF